MPRTPALIVVAMFLGLCLTAGVTLHAQEFDETTQEVERDQSWYRPTNDYQPQTREIIQRKAQTRAAQRDARLASLNWYGMSNARPTAAPTPFTSLYSPVWQQPGGRPFAWNTSTWPGSVVYVR